MTTTNAQSHAVSFLSTQQQRICEEIVKFDANVTAQHVRQVLGPVVDVGAADPNDDDDDDDDGKTTTRPTATPLMVACDRGQVETVRYLLDTLHGDNQHPRRRRRQLVLGTSIVEQAADSGNTAVHYAALAGNKATNGGSNNSIPLMQLLLEHPHGRAALRNSHGRAALDENGVDHNNHHNTVAHVDVVVAAASLVNHHGDTPLMMAVVDNNVELLQWWCGQISETWGKQQGTHDPRISHPPPLPLSMANASDDSAVSLACGHGRVDALKILLQHDARPHALVTHRDYTAARASWQRAQRLLSSMRRRQDRRNDRTVTEIAKKANEMSTCLAMVQEALDRKAQEAVDSLLFSPSCLSSDNEKELEQKGQRQRQNANNKKKKKKHKAATTRQQQEEKSSSNPQRDDQDVTTATALSEENTGNASPAKITITKDAVQLVRLPNGKQGVAVEGRRADSHQHLHLDNHDDHNVALPALLSCNGHISTIAKSTDALFREQLVSTVVSSSSSSSDAASNSTNTTKPNSNATTTTTAENIHDTMEALCLHVSQLLLTPHGMALHLSPSQLDAMEQILQRQCQAVSQAREIQQRLHETANSQY